MGLDGMTLGRGLMAGEITGEATANFATKQNSSYSNPLTARNFYTGGLAGYYDREQGQLDDAFARNQPSPQEQRLIDLQMQDREKARSDYYNTRETNLNDMGLTMGKDRKIRRLTNDERMAIMGKADQNKTKSAAIYAQRALDALSGQTKLPSFLKVDIDHETEKRAAAYKDMLGENYQKDSAYQQSVQKMIKDEEALRSQIQDSDKATAGMNSLALTGGMEAEREGRIARTDQFVNRNMGLMGQRAGLIGQMQQERVRDLNKELERIERRRADLTGLLTVGGVVGGQAATRYGSVGRAEQPTNTYTPTPYQSTLPTSGYNYTDQQLPTAGYRISGTGR